MCRRCSVPVVGNENGARCAWAKQLLGLVREVDEKPYLGDYTLAKATCLPFPNSPNDAMLGPRQDSPRPVGFDLFDLTWLGF